MHAGVKPWVVGVLGLLAAMARAGTVVDAGGVVRDLAADPVRPYVYASVSTREIIAVDVRTAQVLPARLGVAAEPAKLAVDSDGSHLYVVLSELHSIAVIDLAGWRVEGTIPLSTTRYGNPSDIAVHGQRLYAVSEDGLSVVDTRARSELRFYLPEDSFFNSEDIAISPDGTRLFSTEVSGYELCGDDARRDSAASCFCLHGATGEIVPSRSGQSVWVARGGTYHVVELDSRGEMPQLGAIPTDAYPQGIELSADGSLLYISHYDFEVLVADAATRLPFHSEPAQGRVGALALASDGRTIAGAHDQTIELFDVSAPAPNRGGVRLHPIDAVTGGVVLYAAGIAGPPFDGGDSAWVDFPAALLGRAPLMPGPIDIVVGANGYVSRTLSVTIVAGQWTDLGDVALTPSGPSYPQADGLATTPAIQPGATADLVLHGRGLTPDITVSSDDPELTVNDVAYRSANRIDLNVTATFALNTGVNARLRLTWPDTNFTIVFVVVQEECALPPAPIPALHAVKRQGRDVHLEWDDSPRDTFHRDPDQYRAFRSVARPDADYVTLATVPNTPAVREQRDDAGAVNGGFPRSKLHFYRVSALNGAGDSGDRP